MAPSSDLVPSTPHPDESVDAPRWEARLFDAFRLRAPDRLDATPSGRKARALLAFLLASGDDGAPRERLAGLLWSERGEDQARASLRQTLLEIRALTAGGAALIAADRTRVSIDRSRVTTDVARLDVAVMADDAAAVVALVGERPAEFLADLDGIDPAFDEWLSIERTRRRDARRRELIAMAERRLAAGDADIAQRLAERLIASDAADEAAARVAMEASHRRGDPDGVRRTFAGLQSALRRQIGVDVSRESEAAYRRMMASPVERAPADDAASSAATIAELPAPDAVAIGERPVPPPAAQRAAATSATRRPRRLLSVIAALSLGLVGVAGVAFHRGQQIAPSDRRRLSVEPIHVAADDPAAALRVGFAAEVARLVVGEDASFVVHDPEHTGDIAAAQGYVVAANAATNARGVRVDLRLFAPDGGPILWSKTFARPLDQLDALPEQMATKVADVVTCAMARRSAPVDEAGPDALRLLLGACDLRRTDPLEATRLLVRLTAQVPDSAHAWALLAEASAGDEPTGPDDAARTETYAQRAIALDPYEGDAYVGRAVARSGIASWADRMAILREGAAKDPGNADVAAALAENLGDVGYVAEARAASSRAVQADPFSPRKVALHATLMGMSDDGPSATAAFRDASRRFYNEPTVALAEFRFQALVGDHRRAEAMLDDPERGFHVQPERAAMWRALLASRAAPSTEHDAAAFRALEAAMRAYPEVSFTALETLAELHRVDDAYAYAERLSSDGGTEVLFENVTQPLRADPRFMTLAARVGLVKVWKDADRWPDFCNDRSVRYDCRIEAERALSGDARPLVARH